MTQRTVIREPDDHKKTMIYGGEMVDRTPTQVYEKAITREQLAITGIYKAAVAKTVNDSVQGKAVAKTLADTVNDEPEVVELSDSEVRELIVNDFYLLEDKVAQGVLLHWWKEYISAADKQAKKVELRDILFKGLSANSTADRKVLQRLINKVAHWNLNGVK